MQFDSVNFDRLSEIDIDHRAFNDDVMNVKNVRGCEASGKSERVDGLRQDPLVDLHGDKPRSRRLIERLGKMEPDPIRSVRDRNFIDDMSAPGFSPIDSGSNGIVDRNVATIRPECAERPVGRIKIFLIREPAVSLGVCINVGASAIDPGAPFGEIIKE